MAQLRTPTRQEAERWMALAREHGFTDESGQHFELGRFTTKSNAGDEFVTVTIITPLPAGLTTEDLDSKTPPIMFDRTPAGEIIIPGRWWNDVFERLSMADVPEEDCRVARLVMQHVRVGDALLAPDTDTISILAPDHDGALVQTEALIPGTRFKMRLVPADGPTG